MGRYVSPIGRNCDRCKEFVTWEEIGSCSEMGCAICEPCRAKESLCPLCELQLVVVESPFGSADEAIVERNIAYGRRALADCLRRGECPYASHLLYTLPGVLDDNKPEERKLGMRAGFEWARVADARIFYMDYGMSSGMKDGLEIAPAEQEIFYRLIGKNEDT